MEETCPYCDHVFPADQGDYNPPGRVQCPSCGGDFDAENDEEYNATMAGDEPAEAPCEGCGAPFGMPCDPRCPNAQDNELDESEGKGNPRNMSPSNRLGFSGQRQARFGQQKSDRRRSDKIDAELQKQGLRQADASVGENGWYAVVNVDGQPTKVWATDGDEMLRQSKLADAAWDEDPNNPRNQNESYDFDKFMDSTLIKEARARTVDAKQVSPQRQIAARYQERPLGRTRFVRKP